MNNSERRISHGSKKNPKLWTRSCKGAAPGDEAGELGAGGVNKSNESRRIFHEGYILVETKKKVGRKTHVFLSNLILFFLFEYVCLSIHDMILFGDVKKL